MGDSAAGRKKTVFIVILFLGLVIYWNEVAASASPLDQMKSTVDEILQIVRDENLKVPELRDKRREMIMKVVGQRFNFQVMSQLALARNWKARTDSEKKQFVDMFRKILENTYIARVENYSNEEIIYKKEVLKGKGKAVVYTETIINDTEIPIVYRLKNYNDQWLVYDVIIEKVSLIGNYRSQFNQIMSKEDFPGLVKRLEEKIQKMEESGETDDVP
ncbi:phospholipid-binding protein MlaC [Thermodesulfobacteriota bacterium]